MSCALSQTILSDDQLYRYVLVRNIEGGMGGTLVLIMLNPSTADVTINDPTIVRAMGSAKAWGFSRLVVLNLFAYRATKPKDLLRAADPVGPLNYDYLLDAFRSYSPLGPYRFLVAWGANFGKTAMKRDRVVEVCVMAELLGVPLYCLEKNADGSPKHPLYVKGDVQMKRWFCNYEHPDLL